MIRLLLQSGPPRATPLPLISRTELSSLRRRRSTRAVADNHAFDIVSEVNTAEMHNAVVQAQHEIAVRYDFKGTRAAIEYNKKDNSLVLLADHKGQMDTVIQMLKEKMAKRGVAVNALKRGKLEEATHD